MTPLALRNGATAQSKSFSPAVEVSMAHIEKASGLGFRWGIHNVSKYRSTVAHRVLRVGLLCCA